MALDDLVQAPFEGGHLQWSGQMYSHTGVSDRKIRDQLGEEPHVLLLE
jgi:hypothetical protein